MPKSMTDRYQGGQSNDGTVVISRDVTFPKNAKFPKLVDLSRNLTYADAGPKNKWVRTVKNRVE